MSERPRGYYVVIYPPESVKMPPGLYPGGAAGPFRTRERAWEAAGAFAAACVGWAFEVVCQDAAPGDKRKARQG